MVLGAGIEPVDQIEPTQFIRIRALSNKKKWFQVLFSRLGEVTCLNLQLQKLKSRKRYKF